MSVRVPGETPDANDAVIAQEFDEAMRIDEKATGRYHWFKSTGVGSHKPKKRRKK